MTKQEQIEAVKQQVAKAESKGQFDTAHHEVLKNLLKGDKSTTGEKKNG